MWKKLPDTPHPDERLSCMVAFGVVLVVCLLMLLLLAAHVFLLWALDKLTGT